MKKIFLFISLFALAGLFAGCEKDDDDKFYTDPMLIGSWQFMSMTMKIGGEEIEINDFYETLTFLSDGNYESTYQEIGINEETGEIEVYTVNHSGAYSTSGSSLTIQYLDENGNVTQTKGPGSTGYYEELGTIAHIKSQLFQVRSNLLIISGIVEMEIEGITMPVNIRTTYKKLY